MKSNHGAQISAVTPIPESIPIPITRAVRNSHRRRSAHSVVKLRDLQTGEETVVAIQVGAVIPMALKLRPTGLGHGVYKDNVDYGVFCGEWCIGRIYETRTGPESLRWFW